MYSKFNNIEQDKQDRILNAAMKIFSQKGYNHASTNEIVKEAEISKGLLFHYFKNKKQLFLFLYDHSVTLMLDEFFTNTFDAPDLFSRLRQMIIRKTQIMKRYPDLFEFFEVMYTEESPEVHHEIEKRSEKLMTNNFAKLLEDIDITKFKDGLDMKRTINIIFWTLNGYVKDLMNNAKRENRRLTASEIEMEKVVAECDIYIDMLKECFYK